MKPKEEEEKKEEKIKIVKDQDETLANDQLESVAGGTNAEQVECSCDCWISNSNSGAKTKELQSPDQP